MRLASLLALFAACFLIAGEPNQRDFTFEYKATVKDVPAGTQKLELWIPVPHDDALSAHPGCSCGHAVSPPDLGRRPRQYDVAPRDRATERIEPPSDADVPRCPPGANSTDHSGKEWDCARGRSQPLAETGPVGTHRRPDPEPGRAKWWMPPTRKPISKWRARFTTTSWPP